MKQLITVFFSIVCFTANATTYYFAASGNDANAGTSTSAPWKTLSKFNSVFASKSPGDNFLFNRGDVFYGNIVISRSGSSGSAITIGAYGTGANPVISGFTGITAWTGLGSNIWESTNPVSSLSATGMVVVNGINTPMGRYPNSGYLPYQGFVGNISITSTSLTGTPNWTGAEAVIRKQRWVIDRNLITAQVGGLLTYKPTSNYNGQANYGFFIQNDARTLDTQNEWYYNPGTKKLRIYSTSTPSNVQVATKDTLVYIRSKGYLTFDNLTFQGSNKDAFVILSSSNVTIQNCAINYSGGDAIWGAQNLGSSSAAFVLKNSAINYTNNDAINLQGEFTGALISRNVIKNTGVIVGMGSNGSSNYGSYEAIQTNATNTTIEYNVIDSTGYIGIAFNNNNSLIRNNLVSNYCAVKIDGAGIYTAGSGFTGQKILNNIVLNGVGNNAGTNATGAPIAHGIYLDEGSGNIEVAGNSIANCSHTGLYIHNAHNLNVHNNTSFNNGLYQGLFSSFSVTSPIRNDIIKNNIYVSKAATQYAGSFQSLADDITNFGTLDSNYWARPIDDNITINYSINGYKTGGNFTLAQWQAYSKQDAHSKKSPRTITTVNDLIFQYNASEVSKNVPLQGKYIDVKNVTYNGSITLAPYTSAVLIRIGAVTNQVAPTATAGVDQTITLPANSVTLTGKGTDPDGTITAYSWTQVSGPAAATINSPAAATTTITSLVQGLYKFQLKVTDNSALTGVDTLDVTVNAAAGNLLPALNPTNIVNGLDYKYYESTEGYVALPVFSVLTPVKTGTTANFDITLANRLITYSFNYTGYIDVPTDGVYTFYTTSDDGSDLSIDNVPVVDNDGQHGAVEKAGTIGLKAGKHAISVGYFNQGGSSTLVVSYTGPGVVKQAIPSSILWRENLLPAVYPANTVNGLNYKYYESGSGYSSVPNFAALTPVKTGTTPTFDLSLAKRDITYAFNFTGYVTVPADGVYTFYTTSDDGSNLYIDNVLVVNNDGLHGAIEKAGAVGLRAGKHAISVGYFQQGVGSTLIVSYTGVTIIKQVIPTSALYRVVNGVTGNNNLLSMAAPGAQSISAASPTVKAYPNPFATYLDVSIPQGSAGQYSLELIDATGKVVWMKSGTKDSGALRESINTSGLQRGVYFLKVAQNSSSSTVKVQK